MHGYRIINVEHGFHTLLLNVICAKIRLQFEDNLTVTDIGSRAVTADQDKTGREIF